jgi:hypothetical protein
MPTVEAAPRGSQPSIRLRPVPRCDPPFDDERDPQVWSSPHQMALDWSRRHAKEAGGDGEPGVAAGGGALPGGAVPPAGHAGAVPAAALAALPPVVAGASGDARLAVRRFVSMCVEVLNGYRPANHLRRLSLPTEAGRVVAQGLVGSQRVAELRRAARGPSRRSRQPGPVAVLKARLCEPRPGAVEAAVLLVTGERTWAMALRMELHHHSWCATTLHLL